VIPSWDLHVSVKLSPFFLLGIEKPRVSELGN
jgi:hypothetical protein